MVLMITYKYPTPPLSTLPEIKRLSCSGSTLHQATVTSVEECSRVRKQTARGISSVLIMITTNRILEYTPEAHRRASTRDTRERSPPTHGLTSQARTTAP